MPCILSDLRYISSMISYEQFFTLNLDTEKFEDVFLPFDEFKVIYHCVQLASTQSLNMGNKITSFVFVAISIR